MCKYVNELNDNEFCRCVSDDDDGNDCDGGDTRPLQTVTICCLLMDLEFGACLKHTMACKAFRDPLWAVDSRSMNQPCHDLLVFAYVCFGVCMFVLWLRSFILEFKFAYFFVRNVDLTTSSSHQYWYSQL